MIIFKFRHKLHYTVIKIINFDRTCIKTLNSVIFDKLTLISNPIIFIFNEIIK